MLPSDEVQVTMTREECARIHAALRALIEVQRMTEAVGLESAVRLTDAADVIEGVLPRLAEHFPEGDEDALAPEYQAARIEQMGADTKTYGTATIEQVFAPTENTKVSDLHGISKDQAQELFGTQYDEAIRALLGTLGNYTEFSNEDFTLLLDQLKLLLDHTVKIPAGLTVKQSEPYVMVSDLVTLGGLAYEMYQRQGQIDDKITKPF